MNKKFLLLTISADMSKRKTISSKNNFINFATSILMIIDKYLIIFEHLSSIIKITLYIRFSRLLNDKSIIKFGKQNFYDISNTDKEFSFLLNL